MVGAKCCIGEKGDRHEEKNKAAEFGFFRCQSHGDKQKRYGRVVCVALHQAQVAGVVAADVLEAERTQNRCARRKQPGDHA